MVSGLLADSGSGAEGRVAGVKQLLGCRERFGVRVKCSGGLAGLVTAESLADARPVNLQPHGCGLSLQAFTDARHGIHIGITEHMRLGGW